MLHTLLSKVILWTLSIYSFSLLNGHLFYNHHLIDYFLEFSGTRCNDIMTSGHGSHIAKAGPEIIGINSLSPHW